MNEFLCPKCGNTDQRYLGIRNGKIYCRRCIGMLKSETKLVLRDNGNSRLHLTYSLTKEQNDVSRKILQNYQNGKNTYVHAVCGAGKTEIVFAAISWVLKKGGRVGFAIPRRDVVIELTFRIKDAFPENSVASLYGGSIENPIADIVVLTTHQLFRFKNYFTFIILDEADAFPYANDTLLESFFQQSIKGNYVVMSATARKNVLLKFKDDGGYVLELLTRYHNHPLPVPQIKIRLGIFKVSFLISVINRFLRENKPCFIFCPTIEIAEKTYRKIKEKCKDGEIVHSKIDRRMQIIADFKKQKYRYLVTTSILERGVTIANLQVIIFDADHQLFAREVLIQISGRVGRKAKYPNGEVIFLASRITCEMEEAIAEIKSANRSVPNML